MGAVLNFLRAYWKVILLVIILLAVVLWVRSRWGRISQLLQRAFARDNGDYSTGLTDGNGNAVSGDAASAREMELSALALEAYTQLTAGIVNPNLREAALQALLPLNDTELRAAAKAYKFHDRDLSLYARIDSAWMPFSEVDERLMARLANIAMT